MSASLPTYYAVLQVERGAAPEKVRAAYRRMAQKYHPDKMPDNANAVRAMAAINAAYDVLSDPVRRAEHDLWISRAERPSQPMPLVEPAVPTSLWVFMHPARSWAWYLLFGTMLLAMGTITTAVYLTSMPARATGVTASVPCKTAASSDTTVCTRQR